MDDLGILLYGIATFFNTLEIKIVFLQSISIIVRIIDKSFLNERGTIILPQLSISCNTCRCCVFGCYTTEDYFLENEGIFLLIDLLQVF